MPEDILTLLSGKWEDGSRPADIAPRVMADKALLEQILTGLASRDKRVQGGCAEIASRVSERQPGWLYPQLALFLGNLAAREPVLRWEAACTVGNLAVQDAEGKTLAALPALIGNLSDKSIVLQGHSLKALGKIARKHPGVARQVLDAFKANTGRFPGNRLGLVAEAVELMADNTDLRDDMIAFVAPMSESAVAPVAAKAKRTLRKLRR